MEQELIQGKRRQPASIELVVLGLLAALIVVLAIPLISQATNPQVEAAVEPLDR